jgi:hypothetical protein
VNCAPRPSAPLTTNSNRLLGNCGLPFASIASGSDNSLPKVLARTSRATVLAGEHHLGPIAEYATESHEE